MLQLLLIVPLLGALYITDVYIHSICLDIGFCSELFNPQGPWGLLLCSLMPVKPKRKRLTNLQKSQFTLSDELTDITIGLLLGDLSVRKQKSGVNAGCAFRQGILHEDYLNHLYEKFQDLCPQGPKIQFLKSDIKSGKVHRSIWFTSYSLPCFNYLYELFYHEGKKNSSIQHRGLINTFRTRLLNSR